MKTPTTITITLEPDGSSSTETSGFRGGACKTAARPYRELLGAVEEETVTAEGCLPEQVSQKQTLTQR